MKIWRQCPHRCTSECVETACGVAEVFTGKCVETASGDTQRYKGSAERTPYDMQKPTDRQTDK